LSWLCTLLVGLLVACGGDGGGNTEVFLSIDAEGTAREASAVRVAINQVVIELERKTWPLEILVEPLMGDAARPLSLRAWAFKDGVVLGAGSLVSGFTRGRRDEVTLKLVAGAELGPVPEINAEATPGKTVTVPSSERTDGGGLIDDGTPGARADAGTGASDCPQGQVSTPEHICRERA